MTLAIGARVGPYELAALIGEGGMGKVWRAHHTGLKRDDALKVLPDAFASDRDRLARFRREAQVLASLNHPNIAHVYGLEQSDGVQALVMELVEGPTLADRIAQGPIPVDEALPIAKQIAEALEAAHEQGIIHRDLKPANVKVRPDGTVKVLDFGLAKALEPIAARGMDATASPTITSPAMMTGVGVLLGTAAYMSPEQARGKAVDKRSDIWAFGCVLYEMLTGERAFGGEDITETLAAVVKSERAWDALPHGVSPSVRLFLRRCLQKNAKQRLHDIADMRLALEGAFETAAVAPSRPPRWRLAVTATVSAIVASAVLGFSAWRSAPILAPSPVTRFALNLAAGQNFSNQGRQVMAISPDGRRIAYVANSTLYVRSMEDREPKPLSGAGGGPLNPTFSPDGSWIAFWSTDDAAIKRIPVSGGPAITVCPAERPWGISWDANGILFGQGAAGILRAPADGGTPIVLVEVRDGEIADGPQLLPGGDSVLFTVTTGVGIERWERARIVVQSLGTGERNTIIEGGSAGRYVATGHIVYARDGRVFAAPFDVDRLEARGQAVPVVQGVRRAPDPEIQTGVAHFSVSDNGALIYWQGGGAAIAEPSRLVRLLRDGRIEPLNLPAGSYEAVSVSPDGRQVALGTYDGVEGVIWIYHLSGATAMRRLTFGGNNRFPVWSADSDRISFQSDREGDLGIFWQGADGATPAERLTRAETDAAHFPEAWAPSGQTLLFTSNKGSGRSIWRLSVESKTVEPAGDQGEPITHSKPSFSADGRWMAYASSESGTNVVYVQPFPPSGAKYQIAKAARVPLWSKQGSELFYLSGTELFVVDVAAQPTFGFTSPRPVPSASLRLSGAGFSPREFDVAPDGTILGLANAAQTVAATASPPPQIEVVLNWTEELKRLVPTR